MEMTAAPFLRRLRGHGALLLIVLLGLALRLHTLGGDAFIEDEIYTLRVASGDLGSVLGSGGDPSHPPLWYLLLHIIPGATSGSEFALRLPSAILGTLSLPLLYRVGRPLAGSAWRSPSAPPSDARTLRLSSQVRAHERSSWSRTGERVGLLAALFMAVSLFQVFWSQNGRMYAAFTFFSLLSMDAYLRLGDGRRRTWLLYAAATGAGLYTHYFTGLLVAVQVLAYPWLPKGGSSAETPSRGPGAKPATLFLAALALAALAALPLLPMFLQQFQEKVGSVALAPPLDYLLAFQAEFLALDTLPALLLLSAAVFGALVLLRERRRAGAFVLLWLLLPLAVLYPLTAVVPLAGFRMVAFAQPVLPLLAAAGVARLLDWRRPAGAALGPQPSGSARSAGAARPRLLADARKLKRGWVGGLALSLCLVASGAALADVYLHAEEPYAWRDIARSVTSHVAPGDRVVMFPAGKQTHFQQYVPSPAPRPETLPEDTLPRLRDALEREGRAWVLVLVRPAGLPEAGKIGEYLANTTTVAGKGENWFLLLYNRTRP